MLVALPFNIAFGPSMITMPIDIALGVVIPVHAHIGLNACAADYIPKFAPSGAAEGLLFASRCAILGTTTVIMLGLFDLNMGGKGITGVLKALWTEAPHHHDEEEHH